MVSYWWIDQLGPKIMRPFLRKQHMKNQVTLPSILCSNKIEQSIWWIILLRFFCINHVAHRHFRTEKEARKTTSAMRQKKLTLEKATSSLTIWPSSLLLLSSSPTTRVEKNEVGHNQNFFRLYPQKTSLEKFILYSPCETLHAWNNFLVKNLKSSRVND